MSNVHNKRYFDREEDFDVEDEVELGFGAAVISSRQHAIVDFSGVTFMGSLGIRILISAAQALAYHETKIVVLAPQPNVPRPWKAHRWKKSFPSHAQWTRHGSFFSVHGSPPDYGKATKE